MNPKKYLLFFFFAQCLGLQLMAQDAGSGVPKGKGLNELKFTAADSSFSVAFGARIQSLYSGTYSYAENEYADEMQIRRARLKFEGFAFKPELEYKIELALSNSDTGGNPDPQRNNNTANIVLDAVGKWNFARNFSLWFGQTKLPGNRERVISSQDLQFVDRSLLNARFNIDRDLGFQLHHEFEAGSMLIREVASVSMGEGRNVTVANQGGYDFTGRLEVLPFGAFKDEGDYSGSSLEREPTPKLAIGVSFDYNQGASREGGQLGDYLEQRRDLKTLFADAMFKYRGWSVMGEYANKRSERSPVVLRSAGGEVEQAFFTGRGLNLQAGYVFPTNFEIAARYTTIRPEAATERESNRQYTLGFSKYFMGHKVKVQTDFSFLEANSKHDNLMYRFQLELGF
jgi:phosphate-selective porin OprO and OprP